MSTSLRSDRKATRPVFPAEPQRARCPQCDKGMLKSTRRNYRAVDGFLARGLVLLECPMCKEIFFPPGSVDELRRQREEAEKR